MGTSGRYFAVNCPGNVALDWAYQALAPVVTGTGIFAELEGTTGRMTMDARELMLMVKATGLRILVDMPTASPTRGWEKTALGKISVVTVRTVTVAMELALVRVDKGTDLLGRGGNASTHFVVELPVTLFDAVGLAARVINGHIDAGTPCHLVAEGQVPALLCRPASTARMPRRGVRATYAWPSAHVLHSEVRRELYG